MEQLVTNRHRSRRITLSLPAAAHQPIIRSGRIVCQIAILLFGHDEECNSFTERTHTVMLSLHGAGILSTHRFAPEQQLILWVEETNREAVVRVVGEIATERELHTYAVAFLDEGLDFWQTEFPPAQVSDARPMALPLECSSCGQRAEVTSGQFEYDISQIHGGLTRHCAECGVLTVWRRADGKGPSFAGEDKALKAQGKPESDILGKKRRFARSEIRSPVRGGSSGVDDLFFPHRDEAMDASNLGRRDEVYGEGETAGTEVSVLRAKKNFSGLAQGEGVEVPERIPAPTVQEESVVAAAPEPARDPTVERRRRARAKVSFFACVKTAQFGPDIVKCLDMSKGGVSFRSRNPYKKEMKIQIAVPYALEVKNAPSIFVSGRIANVREMEGMWKCGVKFLKGA